jgi:DNA repair protein RadC
MSEAGRGGARGKDWATCWRRAERERRLNRLGPEALTDGELLESLLGDASDSSARAEELLNRVGGLRGLGRLDGPALALLGIDEAASALVACAFELGRRALHAPEQRPRLRAPGEIYQHLRPALAFLRREVFHVLCFNAHNVLLRDVRVAQGTMNACPVDPREVFSAALAAQATALVLAHNHPSGDPSPSSLDIELTRQLESGARLLGLRLLDHLIVAESGYTSLRERGLLLSMSMCDGDPEAPGKRAASPPSR